MPKISSEIKELIERELCYVATASKNGMPSIAPKGSIVVLDEHSIAFGEAVGKKTYNNLLENPRIAVAVADRQKLIGFRLVGKAELITEGPLYEKFVEEFARLGVPKPKAAVKVTIEEVYDLSVRNPGEKIN